MINGAIQPLFAIVFAEILGLFVLPLDEQEDRALFYSLMFLVIGVVTLLGYFFQVSALFWCPPAGYMLMSDHWVHPAVRLLGGCTLLSLC